MKIIILAGGSGTRLFPLSRSCFPKQFLHIAGEKSLLQQTMERFHGVVSFADMVILTNEKYKHHVIAELKEIEATEAHVVCEPVGRNTAPAIGLAMSYCKDVLECSGNEILFVTPSDHLVKPIDRFQDLVMKAAEVAKLGKIVTLGIKPTKPETGFGYIHSGKAMAGGFEVEGFKEKPDYSTAQRYVEDGKYYWNGGMFMFRIDSMVGELRLYKPEIAAMVQNGFDTMCSDFSKLPNISIDYAVAEKSYKMAMIPMEGIYWNDIGSFDSISQVLADSKGDVIDGDVVTKECKNTMILGSDNRLVCGIGLENLMVIDTPDVLLVAKKGESQKVKEIVEDLKNKKRKEVSENLTMYRPWGSYTILAEGPGYKVKRIIINPGEKLSLQLHYHRSEHWTVISGTGKCTLEDKTVIFRENESTYIPIGVKHRLENPGLIPLIIIEVQNGKYLGEDDIIRFEDIYGRMKNQ